MVNIQKKWFDFCNPTKFEHYGYCFTELELRQFPEGRKILCECKKSGRILRRLRMEVSSLVDNMRKTMDKLVFEVICDDG